MCEGGASGLNPARVDFLINSFVHAVIFSGWNPQVPGRSAEPLHLALLSQGKLTKMDVHAQPENKHLLRFEIGDGSFH